jgi:hypothetical protein
MNRFWKSVLLTTLVAGTLDIISAHVDQTIRTGAFPDKMFYAIAGAAIGMKTAFTSGPAIILIGIFIHYLISFLFTLFFYLVYPVLKKLSPNKYLNGLLYAIFVQATMTFLVLPLTALPNRPFVFSMDVVLGIFILTAVFGLPISLMTEKYYQAAHRTVQQGAAAR